MKEITPTYIETTLEIEVTIVNYVIKDNVVYCLIIQDNIQRYISFSLLCVPVKDINLLLKTAIFTINNVYLYILFTVKIRVTYTEHTIEEITKLLL